MVNTIERNHNENFTGQKSTEAIIRAKTIAQIIQNKISSNEINN